MRLGVLSLEYVSIIILRFNWLWLCNHVRKVRSSSTLEVSYSMKNIISRPALFIDNTSDELANGTRHDCL